VTQRDKLDKAGRAAFVKSRMFQIQGSWFANMRVAISDVPDAFSNIANVFYDNILSAVTVAALPSLMTYTSVNNSEIQRLATAERIRQLKFVRPGDELGPRHHEDAERIAREKFDNEKLKPEIEQRIDDTVTSDLYALLAEDMFERAAAELLRETLVMIWGTFENFLSETVRTLVNENPALVRSILTSEKCRVHFPNKAPSFEVLAKNDYDLSNVMGDWLFNERKLDSLPVIRDLISAIYKSEVELQQLFADKQL